MAGILAKRPDAKKLNLRVLAPPDEVAEAEKLTDEFLRLRVIPVYEKKTVARIAGVVEETDPSEAFRAYAKELKLDEPLVELCLGFIADAIPHIGHCSGVELVDIEARPGGRYLVKTQNVIEVEGQDKPALIAEWLFLLVY